MRNKSGRVTVTAEGTADAIMTKKCYRCHLRSVMASRLRQIRSLSCASLASGGRCATHGGELALKRVAAEPMTASCPRRA